MSAASHTTLVTSQFAPQAHAYLTSHVHAQGPDLERLRSIAAAGSVTRALDLGCGGGHVAFTLAPLVREVIAYDLSQAMLDLVRAEGLRRGFPHLGVRQGAAQQLPFPDAHFDLVATRYSAHHWQDLARCLREARRVLKSGGVMVVMDLIAPERVLADTYLQTLELLRDPSHVRDYALGEWTAVLTASGLMAEDVRTYRLRLDFGSWVQRMQTPMLQQQAIRALQAQAPREVADHFAFEPDGSFTIDTMLVQARG